MLSFLQETFLPKHSPQHGDNSGSGEHATSDATYDDPSQHRSTTPSAEEEQLEVTRKNRREGASADSKRSDSNGVRRSEHERRLTGDFTSGKDASPVFPIPMESREHSTNEKSSRRRSNTHRISGSFRPLDSLNRPTHQAANRPGFTRESGNKTIKRPGRLPMVSRTGINVPTQEVTSLNDGYNIDDGPKRKRIKSGDSRKELRSSSPPVDLTGEENYTELSIARHNIRMSSPSQEDMEIISSRPNPPVFTFPEIDDVDNRMRYDSANQSTRENQTSFNARRAALTSVTAPDSLKKMANNENALKSAPQTRSPRVTDENSNRSHRTRDATFPSSDRQGLRDKPERRMRNPESGSAADIGRANSVLEELTSHRIEVKDAKPHKVTADRMYQMDAKRGARSSAFDSESTTRDDGAPSDMRNRFHRAESKASSPKNRQKASARMLTNSNNVGPTANAAATGAANDSSHVDGSEDELQGETTVRSRASPSHPTVVVPVAPFREVARSPKQRASPSDLHPTPFTNLEQTRQARIDQRTTRLSQTGHSPRKEDYESSRIPFRSIYAKGCVLIDEDAELVWNDNKKAFLVEHKGLCLKALHTFDNFRISRAAVSHGFFGCRDTLTALLKGSRDDYSNGDIFIVFLTDTGLTQCCEYLQYATNDYLKVANMSREKMDKTFAQQSQIISDDFKKRSSKRHGREAMGFRTPSVPAMPPPEDEEHVMYEEASPRPRGTGRVPMNSGIQPDVIKSDCQRREQTESHGFISEYFPRTRRSTRQYEQDHEPKPRSVSPVKWTRVHNPPRWTHAVVYPATGLRRVTVDFDDLERLDEGEFLNDNVISFALRHIEETMNPAYRERVHFFNSFFFTALSMKNGRRGLNYDAVKSWTKKMDLFDKDYVVVPINLDLHWFVAIICNLRSIRRKLSGGDENESPAEDHSPLENANETPEGITAEERAPARSPPDATEEMKGLSLSDNEGFSTKHGESLPGKLEPVPSNASPTTPIHKKSKRSGPPPRKYGSDEPAIITLDSFGQARTAEIRLLKGYLCEEGKERRSLSIEPSQLQGLTAKGIPEQANFSDCGVYLVRYVQEFAKNPRRFVNRVLSREIDKETDFAGFDPSAMRSEIRERLIQLHKEQEADHKVQKKVKAVTKSNGIAARSKEPFHESSRPAPPLQASDQGALSTNDSSLKPTPSPHQSPNTKAASAPPERAESAIARARGHGAASASDNFRLDRKNTLLDCLELDLSSSKPKLLAKPENEEMLDQGDEVGLGRPSDASKTPIYRSRLPVSASPDVSSPNRPLKSPSLIAGPPSGKRRRMSESRERGVVHERTKACKVDGGDELHIEIADFQG